MMNNLKQHSGLLQKLFPKNLFAKQNASDHLYEWKKMSNDIRDIERQMNATVENGVDLTGTEAMINREQYRALAERHRSLSARFTSMGQLVSALNTESMLAEERDTVRRMAQQAARLGDPLDYEAALDELMIRRTMVDDRVSAVNEARSRYEAASAAVSIPEDDEYARCVAAAASRREAQMAALATEVKLNAREETTAMEGEVSE